MKTAKIFWVAVLIVGTATYACALEGARASAAPGQDKAVDKEKNEDMSVNTLVSKVKSANGDSEKRQYLDALYRYKPNTDRDVLMLADLVSEADVKDGTSESAFHALQNRGSDDKTIAPAFVKLLEHKNIRVRFAAIAVVARNKDKKAVPALIKRLDDGESVASRAGLALAEIGDETALPELIARIGQPGGHGVAIAKFGAPGLKQLLAKLDQESTNKSDRLRIAQTIGFFQDLKTVPVLKGLLSNKDKYIRANAVQSLGNMKQGAAIEAIKDGDPLVRLYAVEALRKVNGAAETKALLDAFVGDSSNEVRVLAADVLGYKKSAEAIPVLTVALKSDNNEIVVAAEKALKVITGK